jgi:hypothetical protein
VRETERKAGACLRRRASSSNTWHLLSGRKARRVRLEGIRQYKEAVLRQRVCEGGTRCLAKWQARGWSDGSGREGCLDARQVFDTTSAPRARLVEDGEKKTRSRAFSGLTKGREGRPVTRLQRLDRLSPSCLSHLVARERERRGGAGRDLARDTGA